MRRRKDDGQSDVCRYGEEAGLQNMTISFCMDIYDADVKIAMGTQHIEYIKVVRHSHLLVSFGSLITWVSCLDGDDGKGISVKIG